MRAPTAQFHRDGFITLPELVSPSLLPALHGAFDELFHGVFETGVRPDEVNWQHGQSDPNLTRQICNGWKANRTIAAVVLEEQLGRLIGEYAGWDGVRVMIDNVLWKPSGAKALGYHQDNAFLSWFEPSEVVTCWMALDDTRAHGGTIEYVVGSHNWALREPSGEFHAPDDYREPMRKAAVAAGVEPHIHYVEVGAGGGTLHHGALWHGSGPNSSDGPRRALVLHAMPADVTYVPDRLHQGIGPIYSRYKRLGDNRLDENYFPVIWSKDGYRTAEIGAYLSP